MPISFKETSISDLFIVLAHQVKDTRGYLTKFFEKEAFKEKGLPISFSDSTVIMSSEGTLRGLHYQNNPSQSRLICVITGSIFNTALDLRTNSKTFGNYECFHLLKDMAIFVPEHFANGFLALEDNTIVICQFAGKYVVENCNGIIWNDSELSIPWPIKKLNVPLILSERDKKLQTFSQYKEHICLNQ